MRKKKAFQKVLSALLALSMFISSNSTITFAEDISTGGGIDIDVQTGSGINVVDDLLVTYSTVSDMTYVKSSGAFSINIISDPVGSVGEIESVTIDDSIVDVENYVFTDAMLTLSSEYVDMLDCGSHTLSVTFSNGVLNTSFTVADSDTEQNEVSVEPVDITPNIMDLAENEEWVSEDGMTADELLEDACLYFSEQLPDVTNVSPVNFYDITVPGDTVFPVTLDFDADVEAGSEVYVVHRKHDLTWEIIDPDNVADGVITATFTELSPVLILVSDNSVSTYASVGSEPGLYKNGSLVKSWNDLVSESQIEVDGSEISRCDWGLDGDLVIPNSVTSIGYNAFYNCTSLTSISIPDSVTGIDQRAFYGCTSLTSVNIPDGITVINYDTFSGCTSLTSVNIPDSVETILDGAFYNCTSLTTVNIPSSVTSIGYAAFGNVPEIYYGGSATGSPWGAVKLIAPGLYKDGNLVKSWSDLISEYYLYVANGEVEVANGKESLIDGELLIPNSVISIGGGAFSDCTLLTSITIPDSVTNIGNGAFSGCTKLTSVNIPDGVTSIGSNLFSNCTSLTSVNIPNSVTSVDKDAFSKCSALTSINIPNSVISIGRYAFSGCSALTSISIPDGITSIEDSTFSDCTSLASVDIPNGVTSIGNYAFQKCALTTIDIPDGVTSIEMNTFKGCASLTTVNMPNSLTTINSGAFQDCASLSTINIPDGVTSIGTSVFSGCTSLSTINIPNNIASIPGSTFSGCTSLTTIDIPNNITSIDNYVFSNCSALITVDIPSSVTSIGDSAFSNCTNLQTVNIPSSITSIGSSAFSRCTNLQTVDIPNSVTSIGSNAFKNVPVICYGGEATGSPWGALRVIQPAGLYKNGNLVKSWSELVSESLVRMEDTYIVDCDEGLDGDLIIPDGVTFIAYNAFQNCISLTTVNIPDSVTSIAMCAFDGCTSLTTVNIPDSVTSIDSAFSGCTSLTSITIPDGVTSIASSTFSDCTSLTTVNIPDSVTRIDNWAFMDCTSLTFITIPDCVTSIGEYAFKGCTNLQIINIPSSATSIDHYAFSGCTSLSTVNIPSSVTSIGYAAFGNVPEIHYEGNATGAPWGARRFIGPGLFRNGNLVKSWSDLLSEGYITIDPGGLKAVEEKKTQLDGDLVLPSSVTKIGNLAFSGCPNLKTVTIPDSVTIIESAAFENSGITSITIPASVTTLGNYAFNRCSNLQSADLSAMTITALPNGLFSECSALTNVSLPSTLQNIGQTAFVNNTSLANITIPDSVSVIGQRAFFGCANLTSVTMPSSLETISIEAFRASGLTSVSIPSGVVTIGDAAFANTKITSVVVPSSVLVLGSAVFTGCQQLVTADLSAIPITKLPNGTFSGCRSLTTMTLPTGLASIGENAFAGTNLTIAIPSTVTSMDNNALAGVNTRNIINYSKTLVTPEMIGVESGLTMIMVPVYCLDTAGDPSIYPARVVDDPENFNPNRASVLVTKEGLQPKSTYEFGVDLDGVNLYHTLLRTSSTGALTFTPVAAASEYRLYSTQAYPSVDKITIQDSASTNYTSSSYNAIDNAFKFNITQTTDDYNYWHIAGTDGIYYIDEETSLPVNLISDDSKKQYSVHYSVNPPPISASRSMSTSTTSELGVGLRLSEGIADGGSGGTTSVINAMRKHVKELRANGFTGNTATFYIQFNVAFSNDTVSLPDFVVPITLEIEYTCAHDNPSDLTTTTASPTCTEAGSGYKTCTYCGYETNIVIPATGHVSTHRVVDREATPEDTGAYHDVCDACGATTASGTIPLVTLEWDDEWTIDIQPTCTTEGSKSHHCITAGYTDRKKDITSIDPLGHDYTDWVIDVQPTCLTTGTKHRTCQRAGCGDVHNYIIDALGHDIASSHTDPTFESNGYTTHTCQRSGCNYSAVEYDSPSTQLQHAYSSEWTIDVQPTCLTDGSKSHHCTDVGYEDLKRDVTVIDALGHDWSNWNLTLAPNCTTDGREKRTCQRLGCDVEESRTVTALGHDYAVAWTQDVAPTCTTEGSKSHHCSRCSSVSEVTTVPALGHNLTDWAESTAATCTSDGEEERHCQRWYCAYNETRPVTALGHDYNEVYTDPTYDANGYTTRTCQRGGCGNTEVIYDDPSTQLQHTYNTEDWVVDVQPTCTTPGSKSHHCTDPGYEDLKTDVTEIPATGHTLVATVVTPATEDTEGVIKYTCSDCDTPPVMDVIPKTGTANMQGYLTDEDGNPYANKLVTLHSTPRYTITDANGFFKITSVEEGHHVLRIVDYVVTGTETTEELETAEATSDPIGIVKASVKVTGAIAGADILSKGNNVTLGVSADGTTLTVDAVVDSSSDALEGFDPTATTPIGTPPVTPPETPPASNNNSSSGGWTYVPVHNYSKEWSIDKEPTCTEDGEKSQHCTDPNCTARHNVTKIPATGHNFDDGVYHDGKTKYNCSTCKQTVVIEGRPSFSAGYTGGFNSSKIDAVKDKVIAVVPCDKNNNPVYSKAQFTSIGSDGSFSFEDIRATNINDKFIIIVTDMTEKEFNNSNKKVSKSNSMIEIRAQFTDTNTLTVFSTTLSEKYAGKDRGLTGVKTKLVNGKYVTTISGSGKLANFVKNAPIVKMTGKVAIGKKYTIRLTNTSKLKSVKWTSSNKKIATVNSKGIVTAKKQGSVIITGTAKDSGGAVYIIKVVLKVVKKTSLTYTGKKTYKYSTKKTTLPIVACDKAIKVGSKFSVKPTNSGSSYVAYNSSNKKVATVTNKGVVTGKKKGKAVITVTVMKNGKVYIYKTRLEVK